MNKSRIRIALLLDKSGSYDRGLIRGIVKFSRLFPVWEFFLEAPYYTVPDEENKLVHKMKLWNPDIVIMNDSPLKNEITTWGIPVFVTPSYKLAQGVINIISDDEKIGNLGAKYLIDKGFKNFAFYGNDQIFWSKNRKIAFKAAVESLKLNCIEIEALLDHEWQNNPEYLVERLIELPKPIAIMACSDEFGIHIIESSKVAGFRVPQDISVLGVDNDEFICDLYDPPMSSIDQNPEAIGFEVAKNIKMIIDKEGFEIKDILGSNFRIISRLSTEMIAVEDAEVKKALQYILEHAPTKQISVDNVVAATFLSRRILEIRFRKMLHRSILDEINRIRINAVCNHLISTKLPINEIAYSLGFSSPDSFSSYFKRTKGVTPFEFRNILHNQATL
jgi:LacI family transcriptional regulator